MNINIELPTSLADITLGQYKRFLNIQKQTEESHFLNAKAIEIFCEIELKNVMRLKIADFNTITKKINSLFEDKPKLVHKFKIDNVEYGFQPQLDDMTLGEYIDIDTYIGDWDNMEKTMNVLYRPIVSKIKKRYAIKEYDVNTSDALLDMPLSAVLSSIFFFVEFRQRLVENYTEIFGSGTGNELNSRSNFNRKWGWYQSIYTLAQGNIERIENITKLGAHECFLMLSFIQEKTEIEAKDIKKKFKR